VSDAVFSRFGGEWFGYGVCTRGAYLLICAITASRFVVYEQKSLGFLYSVFTAVLTGRGKLFAYLGWTGTW
jgi:hypothetical protein